MNAEQFLNIALGGNMNISTLKPLAWHEIMESYAQYKIKKKKSIINKQRPKSCTGCNQIPTFECMFSRLDTGNC